ncbi:MAG: hypothetical protein AAB276_04650, partial [Pseudomonadota bacterium]
MKFVTQIGCYYSCYPRIKHGDVLGFDYFWGGRASCKRTFLEKYGLFDPVFRFGCEDIELGYRLSKHGLKVVYNSHAVSYMARSLALDDFCNRLIKQGRSQYVFSAMYDDPKVHQWCETNGFEETWDEIGPGYDKLLASTRALDKIAHTRVRLGLGSDPLTERLLYRSYHLLFRAAKVKGMVEAMSKDGNKLGRRARSNQAEGGFIEREVEDLDKLELRQQNLVREVNEIDIKIRRIRADVQTSPLIRSFDGKRDLKVSIAEDSPPWSHISSEESNIPGMISEEERKYYTYIGQFYSGKGEVVELGPWLGCSTYFIIKGLKNNPFFSDKKLNVYDDFVWRADWMNDRVQESERLSNGQSFQFLFEKYSAPFKGHMVVERRKISSLWDNADLPLLLWNGNPIEIIYVDCGRTFE